VPRSAAGCMVRVLAPATITRLVPAITTNGPAVRVQLQASIAVAGALEASATGLELSVGKEPVALKAGELKDFLFPLAGTPNPAKPHAVTALMTTAEGARQSLTRSMNFMGITPMKTPPVADGKLDEWTRVPPVRIAIPDALRVPMGLASGTNDVAADVRMAWDTNALYIAFDVTDDAFIQNQTGWATWMEDCIQIGLNLDPEQARPGAMGTLEAGGMRRWQELDIASTAKGPDVFRTMTYDNRFCPGGPLGKDQATLGIKRNGTRTVYELALPWRTLSADRPPVSGDCIGFACTLNDKDPGEENLLVLGLFNGVYGGKDIGGYGWLVLQ
jgi:hypothetical protein